MDLQKLGMQSMVSSFIFGKERTLNSFMFYLVMFYIFMLDETFSHTSYSCNLSN